MNLVFQPSRNVPPTLPVCEWFRRSLHLLLLSGMFPLALLCTMVTRVTSFFLAGQEDGRKRRETVTPTNQGAGYINSYHLMNEVLGVGGSLTPSTVNKSIFCCKQRGQLKLSSALFCYRMHICSVHQLWGKKHNIWTLLKDSRRENLLNLCNLINRTEMTRGNQCVINRSSQNCSKHQLQVPIPVSTGDFWLEQRCCIGRERKAMWALLSFPSTADVNMV